MKFEIRNLKKDVVAQYFLLLVIFLLPWQTRWIYSEMTLQGEAWEYGQLSIYAVQILIVLAAILLGRPQYKFCAKRVIGLAIMFLGAAFLSVSLALNLSLAMGAILHLVVAVTLFMVLLDGRVNLRQIGLAFVLGLLVPAGLGWWQVLVGTSPSSTILGLAGHEAEVLGQSVVELASGERILRAYGSFAHPNVFGGYLVMGSLLAIWLLARWPDKGQRWLAGGSLLLMLPTLIITFSRSAWLALVTGLLTVSVVWLTQNGPVGPFRVRWKKLFNDRVCLTVFLSFLAMAISAAFFHQAILTRVQPQTRLEAKSIEERGTQYEEWWSVVKMQPISGVGSGNYTLALAHLHPNQPAWSYQPIHNSWLLMVAEVGLFGLVILVWWLWHIFQTPDRPAWVWSGAAALVPLICFDHYLWSSWSGLAILAIFLAFLVRVNKLTPQT